MKAEDKITQALAAKNWTVRDYYHEVVRPYDTGREGGYDITVETEEYPEIWPATSENEPLYEAYNKAWDEVDKHMLAIWSTNGHEFLASCDGGVLMAYSLANVMKVIGLIPDRLTIKA